MITDPDDASDPEPGAADSALASALEFEPLSLDAIDDEIPGETLNGLSDLTSSSPPPTLEEILEDADYREDDDEIDGDADRFVYSSTNSSTPRRRRSSARAEPSSLLDTLSLHSRGSGDSRSRTSGRSGVSGRSRASRARARALKAAQASCPLIPGELQGDNFVLLPGRVDFDSGVPPWCRAALPVLPDFYLAKQTMQQPEQINPTKVVTLHFKTFRGARTDEQPLSRSRGPSCGTSS